VDRRRIFAKPGAVVVTDAADEHGDDHSSAVDAGVGRRRTNEPSWVPSAEIRITDRDRERVVERLVRAHSHGALTLAEFDSRSALVWRAVRRGDLAPMTADLPPDHLLDTVQHRLERPTVGQTALRMLTAAWLTASVLAMVIWGMLCLTEHRLVYPGWIWVVGPVGSALPVLRHYANDSSR
jgi:hypothetical protein